MLPPNFSGDSRLLKGEPDTLNIDWAFAGTATSSDDAWEHETLMKGKPRRCTWTHWIDSHKASGYQDSGAMYKQADGTILEVGKMEKPDTGAETAYEEVWEDPVPQIIHPWKEGEMTPAVAANRGTGKAVCHVIYLNDEEGQKGIIIRVGDWVQGLRIDGEGGEKNVTVERWHWKETEDPKGEWKMMFRIGDGELPCWYVLSEDNEYDKEWPQGAEKWCLIEYELFKPA